MVSVKLQDVTKRFGEVIAADHVSLDILSGEFFTLLGPSGCGKTTTLRCIAGFEELDEGRIYFDAEDITNRQPYERNTGMVFQSYALWPHMSVFDNIAYGLKIRKFPRNEIKRKVSEALGLIGLEGMEKRTPSQLSGGQQQRVALARALVVEPGVLLLDEPLSNLDAKERVRLRGEIRSVQRELRITSVYVTHDQEEALCISDRIAVQYRGRLQQIGTPTEIYEKPSNVFVADFLGFEGAVLDGEIRDGKVYLEDLGLQLEFQKLKKDYPRKVKVIVKPNDVEVHENSNGTFLVKDVSFLGPMLSYEVEIYNGKIVKVLERYVREETHVERGRKVNLKIREPIRVFG